MQQIGDDRRGSRGHAIRIGLERGNRDVRDHHGVDSSSDGFAERRQFDGIQACPVSGDLRQTQMRIGCGVAVTGEVFGRGHHSIGARSLDVCGYEISNLLGIFSEGASIDDRIRGIRIYVRIGKEIPVHSDSARLLSGDAAEGFRVIGFSGRAEGHGVGEHGGAMQTHGNSTLEVGSEEQRQFGFLLQTIEQFGSFVRLVAVEEWRLPAHRHGE